MALVKLFFNLFPVLTSLSFAKSFLHSRLVTDEGIKGRMMMVNGTGLKQQRISTTTNTTTTVGDSATIEVVDYNVLKFCGQLRKLLDLPLLFTIILVQMISFVLVLNIEECSPLVLFSWWRNKIS